MESRSDRWLLRLKEFLRLPILFRQMPGQCIEVLIIHYSCESSDIIGRYITKFT